MSLGMSLSINCICCVISRHVSHSQFCVCDSQSKWSKSHFLSAKIGKSQFPFYPFRTLFRPFNTDYMWKYDAQRIFTLLISSRESIGQFEYGEFHSLGKSFPVNFLWQFCWFRIHALFTRCIWHVTQLNFNGKFCGWFSTKVGRFVLR